MNDMNRRYLTGTLDAELEALVKRAAISDAKIAISEGAVAPWGDGETLPDVKDLLRTLRLSVDHEQRADIGRAYDRFFREAIDERAAE
jgi:hypothetical protein